MSATPSSVVSVSDRLRGSDTTTTPQTQDSQSTQRTLSPEVLVLSDTAPESLLWVDKYKPTNIRQIIGQQGDRSNAKKLLAWLQNWHANLGRKPACEPVENVLLSFSCPEYCSRWTRTPNHVFVLVHTAQILFNRQSFPELLQDDSGPPPQRESGGYLEQFL